MQTVHVWSGFGKDIYYQGISIFLVGILCIDFHVKVLLLVLFNLLLKNN